MAKEDLLKGNPDTQFTSGQEAARIGRKGGIASGVARRKKCASRKFLKEVLALVETNHPAAVQRILKGAGVDPNIPLTIEEVGVLSLIAKFKAGDTRVFDQVHEYLAEDPHTLLEEKRIKAQQAAIESLKNSDGFMQAMGGVVEEVFDDGGDTPDTLEDSD